MSFALNRNDISTPDTSRYLYFVVALSLPLIALALQALARTPARALLVGVLVCYLVVEQGLLLVAEERQYEAPVVQQETLGLARLIADGEQVYSIAYGVDVNTASITRWVQQGALGDLSRVGPQAVLDARAAGQVRNDRAPRPDAPADGIAQVAGAAGALGPHSCSTAEVVPGAVAARVRLEPGQTLGVTLEDRGALTYRAVDSGLHSAVQTIKAPVHETRWFSTLTPLTLEFVATAGERLRFCTP
jgi:hypothetical protein